jgi:hypothetical protein
MQADCRNSLKKMLWKRRDLHKKAIESHSKYNLAQNGQANGTPLLEWNEKSVT